YLTHPLTLPSTCFFISPTTAWSSTFSLHDALPISRWVPTTWALASSIVATVNPEPLRATSTFLSMNKGTTHLKRSSRSGVRAARSEEHTSELQSRDNLVCRLLLEKKKKEMTIDGSV